MQTKHMLLSEHVRKRVQLGIVPVVVGSVISMGATDLLELVGFEGAVALLAALTLIQMYLIAARVRFDFLGPSR